MEYMTRKTSVLHLFNFWLLVVGLIAIGLWAFMILRQTSNLYDGVIAQNATLAGTVGKVSLPDTTRPLTVPNWTLFKTGNIWSLTSNVRSLPADFQAPDLIDTSLAHGDSDAEMQVQKTIEQPLRRLFDAAEQNGIELMISSAYRSVNDQQKLYSDFVAKQGAEMAALYVAKPGTSEHHTGLSIDLSTVSSACEEDSDSCSLSQVAAGWLKENAPKYGFVQRYPEGKRPITGVAFEPWHYRYLGIPMARSVATSGLTYDEVIRQIAPGYAYDQVK